MNSEETTSLEVRKPTQAEVYERFVSDNPQYGTYNRWYEQVAAEAGVDPRTVKKWVAIGREKEFAAGPDAKVTLYQAIGREVGANVAEAVSVLAEQLQATNQIRIHDRDGKFVREYETPDNRARQTAAAAILKFHNAAGADQIALSTDADMTGKSDEELDEIISKHAAKVADDEVVDIEKV